VFDLARVDGGAKFVGRHAGADFALKRFASCRCILDADDVDGVDLLQTEVIVSGSLSITKPGLTPVPQERDVLRARCLLQFAADLVIERKDSSSQVETT